MADLDALLEAVVAAPEDWAPRGVLADWLQENGDERHDTVRRAPDAQRAVFGFPDVAGRLAWQYRWEDCQAANADGSGPRVLCVRAIPADNWPYIALRLTPPAGDFYRIQVGNESSVPAQVVVWLGGQRITELAVGPHGVAYHPIDPWPVRKPLAVEVSGAGAVSVILELAVAQQA